METGLEAVSTNTRSNTSQSGLHSQKKVRTAAATDDIENHQC